MGSEDRRLSRSDLDPNPIAQFRRWFDAANQEQIPIAEGMALATAGADGQPSLRVVLLKEIRDDGFVFFTNYTSRKGEEISRNPQVALTIWWATLERQIRIEGEAARTSPEVSDAYFASRPRGSRISASISAQSRPVESRAVLEQRAAALEEELEGRPVPRPEEWGGYLVRPDRMEFWQGREDRLHDRFVYEKDGDGWTITRLSP